MKLFLSSSGLGENGAQLRSLVRGGKRIGVIGNALDYGDHGDDGKNLAAQQRREFRELSDLGLMPEELDLRQFFGGGALRERFTVLDAVWVLGGNTFILRRAMRQSGFDALLLERVRDPDFVYAGYSAGACVVTPTLKGIHLPDNPGEIPRGYDAEIVWDGLDLVPFCIAPHYHPKRSASPIMAQVVEYFIAQKLPFIVLRDGEFLIRDAAGHREPA